MVRLYCKWCHTRLEYANYTDDDQDNQHPFCRRCIPAAQIAARLDGIEIAVGDMRDRLARVQLDVERAT